MDEGFISQLHLQTNLSIYIVRTDRRSDSPFLNNCWRPSTMTFGPVSVALLAILTILVPLAWAQPADSPGSEDHPMVIRYEGSFIDGHKIREFDEFRLPLGPAVWRWRSEQVTGDASGNHRIQSDGCRYGHRGGGSHRQRDRCNRPQGDLRDSFRPEQSQHQSGSAPALAEIAKLLESRGC